MNSFSTTRTEVCDPNRRHRVPRRAQPRGHRHAQRLGVEIRVEVFPKVGLPERLGQLPRRARHLRCHHGEATGMRARR